MKKVILILLAVIMFAGCKTIPEPDTSGTDMKYIEVEKAQEQVAASGQGVAQTIDEIKKITDDAKGTGEVKKTDVHALIRFVDISAEQIAKHNALVKILSGKIEELEAARRDDNKAYDIVIQDRDEKIRRQGSVIRVCTVALLVFVALFLVKYGIKFFLK